MNILLVALGNRKADFYTDKHENDNPGVKIRRQSIFQVFLLHNS